MSRDNAAGYGTTLSQLGGMRAINARPSPPWQHPWQTSPQWYDQAKQWTATIYPGFLNGMCPVWRTTIAGQEAATGQDFGTNPLTGQPFFSADVFSAPPVATPASQVDIPLYLTPQIPLQFYPLGFDAPGSPGVPSFFQNLGVANAPVIDPSNIDADEDALNAPPPAGNRLLRACDLILHQPRTGLTSTITSGPGLVTGISNNSQTLAVAFPPSSDSLQILSGQFVEQSPTAGINSSTGDYTEPTYDEILISTVFLLSAPNAEPGSAPDGTWTPYVAHSRFWNLSWAQPVLHLPLNEAGTAYIVPFAGGAAQGIINFDTSEMNDALQQVIDMINAYSLAGIFWTPTGGGHTSAFSTPPPAPVTVPNGLDKAALIAAQTQAAQSALLGQSLDPAFPFAADPFQLSLLAQ